LGSVPVGQFCTKKGVLAELEGPQLTSFIINDRLFTVGGCSLYDNGQDVYSRSLNQSADWKKEVDFPGCLTYTSPSAVVHNGTAYIIGGSTYGSTYGWKWAPGMDHWEEIPPTKEVKDYYCTVLVNNRFIFVLSGRNFQVKFFEVFDIVSQRWSTKSVLGLNYKYPQACVALYSSIYVYAAKLSHPNENALTGYLYRYDTEEDKWHNMRIRENDICEKGPAMFIV